MDGMIPRSKSGWWTGWLIAGFAACYLIGGLFSALIQSSGSSSWQPVLTAVAIGGLACILGALIAAIAALAKRDRSAPVYVAVGLGIMAVLFLAGDLLVRH